MKTRITIVAVFVVFFAPVLVAVFMHSTWFDWRPGETRNHGELLQPPHRLEPFALPDHDGHRLEHGELDKRWQLLHVIDGPCDGACQESMYWLRQVRRAQDRHQPDVDLLLAMSGRLDAASAAALADLEAGIRVLDNAAGREFLTLLPDDPRPVSYILDPQNHIILRYPDGSDFNGMRRDLRRLLTWTRTDPSPSDTRQPDS